MHRGVILEYSFKIYIVQRYLKNKNTVPLEYCCEPSAVCTEGYRLQEIKAEWFKTNTISTSNSPGKIQSQQLLLSSNMLGILQKYYILLAQGWMYGRMGAFLLSIPEGFCLNGDCWSNTEILLTAFPQFSSANYRFNSPTVLQISINIGPDETLHITSQICPDMQVKMYIFQEYMHMYANIYCHVVNCFPTFE